VAFTIESDLDWWTGLTEEGTQRQNGRDIVSLEPKKEGIQFGQTRTFRNSISESICRRRFPISQRQKTLMAVEV